MSFQKKYRSVLLHLLFAACLLPAMIFAYRRPHYNMDMVSYMAIILEMDRGDTTNIHRDVYEAVRREVPPIEREFIINSPGYRENMMNDAAYFHDHLPIYRAKPLYNRLCYFFYKAGFSLTKATCMPGIVSFFLAGMLLLHWLFRVYPSFFSWIAALLLMYAAFMINMPRISSPDCLSIIFLLTAFYFILEKYSPLWMFVFFLLAIFCRMDNAVTASLMIGALWLFGKRWGYKMSFLTMALMGASILGTYLLISSMATKGAWGLWYYADFMKHFNVSNEVKASWSFNDYLALVYSKFITGLVFSHVTLFLLLAFLTIYDGIRIRKLSFGQFFISVILVILAIRFFIFPDISDRFYATYYLLIMIVFLKKFIPLIQARR